MSHERALDLARVQDGLITRVQAIAAGMTPSAIRHALRADGPWRRALPGVYATFSGPLGDLHRVRAASLGVGGEVMITGAWACWMAGLSYGPERDEFVDVLVGRSIHRRTVGFVRIRSTTRVPSPTFWVDEDAAVSGTARRSRWAVLDELAPDARPGTIAVVPAARAVVDTVTRLDLLSADWSPECRARDGCPRCWHGARHLDLALRNVRALLCEVVQRRKCTVPVLAAEVWAAPVRGGRLVRAAMADIEAGCRSAPECELRDLVRTSRIVPEPRWNESLPGARGIYPDACWPEARLVVEVDSRSFHGFGDAPERTEQRRARYAALGWRVLPVSPARLRSDPRGVLREIEAAYRAGLR